MKPLLKIALSLSVLMGLSFGAQCMAATAVVEKDKTLQGEVSDVELLEKSSRAPSMFDVLDDVLLPTKSAKTSIAKNATKTAAKKVTSLGNYVFDLRGFDWSIEGADIALDEKLTYKNENAREYVLRRQQDKNELDAVYSIFQTGMVLGAENVSNREQNLADSKAKLVTLFGEEKAATILEKLQKSSEESQDDASKAKPMWSVDEQREKLKLISEAAIEKDPVIKDLLTRMHKFNGRSKFARVTAKLVYTTLGIASFAPTFVAPAAEASMLTFMTLTGGPEQDKLLREMYLHKCLESRYKTIGEEAHLIVTNGQIAALTNNKPLTVCSVELVNRLGADESKVFTAQ